MTRKDFPERKILLAPFGRYTGYVFSGYVRNALVIGLALLSVALAVDLVPQVTNAIAGRTATDAAAQIGKLLVLRSLDLFPRFIALASFLAVLWTEISHTVSRERILVWNTGRAPLRCLMPVILFALMLGTIQFSFDAYIRPAAMAIQIDQHLGNRGEQFDRHATTEKHWIASGNALLLSRLDFGPPPVLRDLTLYRLDENGRLSEVVNAISAVPGTQTDRWILRQGSYWTIPPESRSGVASVPLLSRSTKENAIRFEQREINLSIDPLWISVWGIYPEYLPQAQLAALAHGASPKDPRALFVTRYYVNYANALMPGAMALLAASLCLLLFAFDAPLGRQLAMLPVGYAGHLTMKTFILMGEDDYMNPVIAAWVAPAVLLLATGLVLLVIEYRRRA